MRLTRDHIIDTFPVLAMLHPLASREIFEAQLARAFAGHSDNLPYGSDLAKVVMSHVYDDPYSALPAKLQSYRASVDLFIECAAEKFIRTYIRIIARTMQRQRRPRVFRNSLISQAHSANLPISSALLGDQPDKYSRVIQVRLTEPFYSTVKARARALGVTPSGFIRELLYSTFDSEYKGDY